MAVKYPIMIPYIYRSPSLPRHFRAIAQLTLPASLGGTINPIFYGLGKPKKVVELAEVTQHVSDSTICRGAFSPSFPLYPDPPGYVYPCACADTLTHARMCTYSSSIPNLPCQGTPISGGSCNWGNEEAPPVLTEEAFSGPAKALGESLRSAGHSRLAMCQSGPRLS